MELIGIPDVWIVSVETNCSPDKLRCLNSTELVLISEILDLIRRASIQRFDE